MSYLNYTPNFSCTTDGNEKGLVNANVGLITYDEVVYAGGYYARYNSNYYLYNNRQFWSMSLAGYDDNSSSVWHVNNTGHINGHYNNASSSIRPVVNIKLDTKVTGTGTISDPYVIG